MPRGKTLRVEALAPARLHWGLDNWRTSRDSATRDTGLGVHLVDLPTDGLPAGNEIVFTFFWPQTGHWEGIAYAIIK
jgi:glucoamylase